MSPMMVPRAWTTDSQNLGPDPAGYEVDDLIIDLASQRVSRAGTVIPLQALSFDLLVTLVRAGPNLVSFEQLTDRVWPGLVITPETIVQRVKLVRGALGDDARAPRYIAGVRGRGYRLVAQVRPIAEPLPPAESIVPAGLEDKTDAESASVRTSAVATEAVAASSSFTVPSAPVPDAGPRRLGWVGGAVIIVSVLATLWAITHYRGANKPAEQANLQGAVQRATEAAPAIHSLAVLPLENLSGDQEQEYFADGMTDALTTNLAQIGSLRVISRTSAMHFKGSKETLPQIGRDLQVDAVVEGTVTRGENRVRVTAQLVEARSDQHLWASTYERDLKDVLALQDEIAQDIAEQIRVKLTPKERSLFIQIHAVDPEAHDAFLRGGYWVYKANLEGGRKALEYYQKAIARDPSYALAYAGVARALTLIGANGGLPYKEAASRATEAATKALALDPSLAEPHLTLAFIKLFTDWDWSGAEAEFKQSIALNPNLAGAHVWYSYYLVIMERLEEAVTEGERARDLDPFDFFASSWLGEALYHGRRYQDALRQLQRTVDMFPDHGYFSEAIADVYEQKRMFAEAFAARLQALSLEKDPSVIALGEAYKRAGYRGYLLKRIEILEQGPHRNFTFPILAHLYAMLGDDEHAISNLELAYEEHNPSTLFIRTAPELDSLRSSPRFRDLVRRIGFPQPSNNRN